MLEIVIGLYRDALAWIFNIWNSIYLAEGVSLWNLILVAFVSMGFLSVIIRNFGGNGIAHEVTDTYNSVRVKYSDEAKKKAQSKKEN